MYAGRIYNVPSPAFCFGGSMFELRPSKKFGRVLYRDGREQDCPYMVYPCSEVCALFRVLAPQPKVEGKVYFQQRCANEELEIAETTDIPASSTKAKEKKYKDEVQRAMDKSAGAQFEDPEDDQP
jgi:hypothetical protein